MQQATAEELSLARRIQADPEWFVRECLGDRPWDKQVEILESVRDHPRTAVRSCHGAGKSFIAARAVLWYLFAHPDSIVVTTAPTGRQVRKILWAELRQAYNKSLLPLGGECLTTELKIDSKWFAFGFATDDGDSFQGPHAEYVLVVVDEASGVDAAIWTAVEGLLSSAHCRLLAIGNPTDPSGNFASEFKTPGTNRVQVSAFDTPNFTEFGITLEDIKAGTWEQKITHALPYPALTTPAWVADKWRRWGEESPLWEARVAGQFPKHGSDALIPLIWIEKAQERTLEPTSPNELGVDVARFGDDETIITHRRGPHARIIVRSAKEDTMQTSGRVVVAHRDTKADSVKVDDAGLGGGVTDRLRELGLPVTPVNVGEGASDPEVSADPERYANLRAELWWAMRIRFQDGEIDIDPADDELASQLAAIKYKFTSGGKIQIESKQEAKRRGIESPDRADSLMLSFAPAIGYDLGILNG